MSIEEEFSGQETTICMWAETGICIVMMKTDGPNTTRAIGILSIGIIKQCLQTEPAIGI
jgi:hypothetical protein